MSRILTLLPLLAIAGCCSPWQIDTRQRIPPRAKPLPRATLVVAPYDSAVAALPKGCWLLDEAQRRMVRDMQMSEIFQRVEPQTSDAPSANAYVLRCKIALSTVKTDTGFVRNLLAIITVIPLFLDSRINEVVRMDHFEVQLESPTLARPHRWLYEYCTVGRFSPLAACRRGKRAQLTYAMFLAANRNLAVDLIHDMPRAIAKAAAAKR